MCKRFQDHEFCDGQGNVLAIPMHPVSRRVHFKPSAHNGGIAGDGVFSLGIPPVFSSAQDGANTSYQQTLREWLGYIIVSSGGKPQFLVDLVILGRQENDRHLNLFPQPFEQLQSVHPRHLYVEDAKIRRIDDQSLESGLPVRVKPGTKTLGLKRN